jgi:hypothetical protein
MFSTLTGYDARITAPYLDGGDKWSAAAEAAFETLAHLKKATADLMWICGDEREKTSEAIAMRWTRVKSLLAYISKPGNAYSMPLMESINDKLLEAIRDASVANVTYDEYDCPTNYFGYHLSEYAELIITALKGEMNCGSFGDGTEAETFEDNR